MEPDERTILYARRRRVLKAVGGVQLPDVLLSDAGPCVIGRGAGSDVVISDTAVSRRHAQIIPRGEDLVIVDLGSSNGVHVNGQRVSERVLADGDTVAIGECVFRFSDSDAPPSFCAPAAAAAASWSAAPESPAPRASAPARKISVPRLPAVKLPSVKLPSIKLPSVRLPSMRAASGPRSPAPQRLGKPLRLALVGAAVFLAALLVLRVAMRPSRDVGDDHAGRSTGQQGAAAVSPPELALSPRELADPNVQQARIFFDRQEHGKALVAVQRALGSGLESPAVRGLSDRIAKQYEAALAVHLRRADDMEQQMQYRPALGALGAAVDLIGELNDPRLPQINARIRALQAKVGG
jgi:hypothetical protein